jgi:sporulation protein YlmC with PRC-barrel domain
MATTTMTMFNPTSHADYDMLLNKDVYSSDGEKVGTVKRVYHPAGDFNATRGRHFFLLDPGMLKEWFGGFSEVYLPESAIEGVGGDRVAVSFTKDQIKNQKWTTKPADIDRYRWS